MAAKRKPQGLTIQNLINRYAASILSPQQQRAQARKDVNLALKDSFRDLRTTYQQEYERARREQYAQQYYGQQLKGFGQPGSYEANAIRDAYAQAAGQNQAFSSGLIASTTGQQAANVAGSEAAGANLAGYSGPSVEPSAGANAQVLNYLNSLPAGTFAAQGTAGAAHLGSQAAAGASAFGLKEAQLGQTLREMSDKYFMARKDLDAQRAGKLQEALGGYRESGRGDISTLINALYLQNTQQKDLAAITGTYKGKPTQAAKETAAEIAIKAASAQSQATDRIARQEIARMNAATAKQRARISQQNANTSALAAAGNVTKAEQDFRKNAQKYVAGIINVDKKRGVPRKRPPSRQTLINYVYRMYGIPLAGKYGLTKEMLAQWAAQVVSTFPASYWDPKTYGVKPKKTTPGASGGGVNDIIGGNP